MTKVYCYSRCTTCKKALKWLDDNKIEYEQNDINVFCKSFMQKGLAKNIRKETKEDKDHV